ncbi:hypothetical protein D1Y72_02030 [Riemerella anatipestifer]|nr:hypothetical protein [Riemerella anatipestifer]
MKSRNIYPHMLFNSTFFNNLVSLKKHLLWLVEIERKVQFNPTFVNTFPVSRNFTQNIES